MARQKVTTRTTKISWKRPKRKKNTKGRKHKR